MAFARSLSLSPLSRLCSRSSTAAAIALFVLFLTNDAYAAGCPESLGYPRTELLLTKKKTIIDPTLQREKETVIDRQIVKSIGDGPNCFNLLDELYEVKSICDGPNCFNLLEELYEVREHFRVFYSAEDVHGMWASSLVKGDEGSVHIEEQGRLCFYCGMDKGGNGPCISPKVLEAFLDLLNRDPFSDQRKDSSMKFTHETVFSRYSLQKELGHGSFGDVWLASMESYFTDDPYPSDYLFVLKRIMVEKGTSTFLSGLREKHFGEIFLNESLALRQRLFQRAREFMMPNAFTQLEYCPLDFTITSYGHEEGFHHIGRYVESFETETKGIWIVFRHEGISLSKLMYTVEGSGAPRLHPSPWWQWLKTTKSGRREMQNLIWQLLMGLKSCHERGITHRDIKPENMIICFEDGTGICSRKVPGGTLLTPKLRIIDFGSAIDEFTINNLYGSGPTRSEQTFAYTPPEALLNSSWYQGRVDLTVKYDMWSAGIVIMELILGSPDIFQISGRDFALLRIQLASWSKDMRDVACKLRGYMDLCIANPIFSSEEQQTEALGSSSRCSEDSIFQRVKKRDPLNIGFPNIWALRLVRQLLVWDPVERLGVDDALKHPYFEHLT